MKFIFTDLAQAYIKDMGLTDIYVRMSTVSS